ncbi:alpha/beta hydrolase domain-containing protein isoform X2 [Senna tora]|uniref:Alpha/beta hydrolase domain-containing protein isoform X2 n=1 Tax=Senna tora TaxID=362788 RepID=A0A834X568_9FABA|nr:alpha/beta hydrolase domain-containing protein isoform X2 [Senna tora]
MDTLLLKLHLHLPNSSLSKSSPSSLNFSHQARISIPRHYKLRKTAFTFKMSQAAQNPSVPQQKVVIPNKHGEKLVGILQESGTTDIVILCHGFRSTKESNAIINLAAALDKAGISSFRFDFAGNGESEGSFQYGNYWREVEDLRAVAQHLCEANHAVKAIVGHSKGGGVVLLYASKYHDIKTVVNLSGRYDLKSGIEERLGKDFMERIKKDGFIDVKNKKSGDFEYRVTEESLMDRLNTNMHEACLKIDKECRVFTVHGSADQIIRIEDASEFAKIIPNHKLHIIEGADHSYTQHQDELASVVEAEFWIAPAAGEDDSSIAIDLSNSSVSRKSSLPQLLYLSSELVNVIFSGNQKPRRTLNLKMAQAAQNPCFHQQQKVIIPNKQGNKLVGILHESGTSEIVILCHGLGSSKEDNIMINLASALENAGISSFRFDFTGNGYWLESEATKTVKLSTELS